MSMASSPRNDEVDDVVVSTSTPSGPLRINPWLAAGLAIGALVLGTVIVRQLDGVRHERFVGRLSARASAVSVPFDAELDAVLAPTGTLVKRGTPIVRLKNASVLRQIAHGRREIAALEKEHGQAEAKYRVELEWRKRSIEAEMFETRIKSAGFLRQKLSHEVEQLAWKSIEEEDKARAQASGSRLVNQVGFRPLNRKEERVDTLLKGEAARNATEVAAAQVELCDQRLVELKKLLEEIPAQVRTSIGIELVEQKLADAKEALASLEAQQSALTLTAASTGIVGVYRSECGGHVAAHETIVQILDEDRPYLELEVPAERIVELRTGDKLDLVFPGDVERTGRIESIPPQTAPADAGARPMIRVPVAPAGKLWPKLPFGTTVDVLKSRFHAEKHAGK